jgi:hypothetical protein
MFGPGMGENLADLRIAAAALEAGHQVGQRFGVGDPFAGPAFPEAAEIKELHLQRLAGDGLEHLALELAGKIPCRLPAHGGIEREQEPPLLLPGRGRLAERVDLLDECGNLAAGGLRLARLQRLAFVRLAHAGISPSRLRIWALPGPPQVIVPARPIKGCVIGACMAGRWRGGKCRR